MPYSPDNQIEYLLIYDNNLSPHSSNLMKERLYGLLMRNNPELPNIDYKTGGLLYVVNKEYEFNNISSESQQIEKIVLLYPFPGRRQNSTYTIVGT